MHFGHVDLPPEAFPMTVEAYAVSSGAKVWETTVQHPGGAVHRLRIPSLAHEHGAVWVRVTYADGEVYEADTSLFQSLVERCAALMAADADLMTDDDLDD